MPALVELEAGRHVGGQYVLHVAGPAIRITLVVRDGSRLLFDDDTLDAALTGCLEVHLAQGVALAVPDEATGLLHHDRAPRPLNGEPHSSKE